MTERQKTKRAPPISYRPPAHLQGAFDALVEKSGLSVNAFLNKLVFDAPPPRQSRRPAVELEELARLLVEAARIRTALDTIALNDGDNGNTLALKQAVEELTVMRAALLKAMGRKP